MKAELLLTGDIVRIPVGTGRHRDGHPEGVLIRIKAVRDAGTGLVEIDYAAGDGEIQTTLTAADTEYDLI